MDTIKNGANSFLPFQNHCQSLRKSLVLYVIAFTIAALALCGTTSFVCESARRAISDSYPPSGEKYYLTTESGERLGEGGYIDVGASPVQFSERDQRLCNLLELLPILTTPLYSSLCILAAAFFFYRNRLKKPLAELRMASEKISHNDLNFTLTYERKDELGELCSSFETMRAALADNFSEMWRHMEERRRLNAAFAHDLRTPLTVLKGYDEMLRETQDPQTKATAVTMGKHIARMERYVESMSQLQRLEDRQPEYRTVDLQELLPSLCESAAILCRENGKEIRVANQAASSLFTLDAAFLSQVCGNLASNAARYAHALVTFVFQEREGGLALSVSDDGPGFRQDILEKAAEPYATGEKNREEHFGLGLYICRLLCQRHGGWLQIENTPSGARVTAFLGNGQSPISNS